MCRRCATRRSSCASQGTIFLAGPPLVKAATGEVITRRGAGRRRHPWPQVRRGRPCRRERRARAGHRARHRRARCNRAKRVDLDAAPTPRAARLRPGRALRHRARRRARALRRARSHRAHRRRLASSHEFKALYGTTLVCGFARIWGMPVGDPRQQRRAVLRKRAEGRAFHRARLPARASRCCSCRTSPASWSAANTRPAASPRTAPSWSPRSPPRSVPKFTVLIGGSFGAGNYGMCGRAYSPRFLFTWPNAASA